jgi:hypothetical protein
LKREPGIYNEAGHETCIYEEKKVVPTAAYFKELPADRSKDIAGRLDSLEEQVMIDIVI